MKKKTIAQLEKTIEELENSKSHWYNKYIEQKEKEDKQQRAEMFCLQDEKKELLNQVANLLEIIRWHINPSTAESPFLPVKSQREDGRKNY